MSPEPRPAATLILLRRGGRHVDRGTEVLMVRRSLESGFMPGVWVFPGGVVEPDEDADELRGDPGHEARLRAPLQHQHLQPTFVVPAAPSQEDHGGGRTGRDGLGDDAATLR